jgi:hypothetical protein
MASSRDAGLAAAIVVAIERRNPDGTGDFETAGRSDALSPILLVPFSAEIVPPADRLAPLSWG